MSTPATTPPPRRRLLSIVDAPPSVQQWVDVFIESAVAGTPQTSWPHAHPDVPVSTLSLKDLWMHIEEVFTLNGHPWSVLAMGFPPPVDKPDVPGVTPGDRGFYHTLLHRMLGDFHKHEG
jgi:hypothetical protein